MKQEDYLTNRVQNQIDWFNAKSGTNRKVFQRLRAVQIIAGALIPFLSGLLVAVDGYQRQGTATVGALGVIVTIVTGIMSLGRYRENWVEYRKMNENLQREKFLYETEVAPYHEKNRFDLLVQNVESLLAKENLNWSQYITKPDSPEVTKVT